MEWQRARSEEQKAERMQQIMDATEELFIEYNYAEINLKMIADKLDFTRANLYKYVQMKEEVFLNIFVRHLHHWVEAVLKELPLNRLPMDDREEPRNIGSLWARLWQNCSSKLGRLS